MSNSQANLPKELLFLRKIREFPSVEGIGDDCYYFRSKPDAYQLVSTDMLVDGNHFDSSVTSWVQIGEKSVTVNASDIYCMGGQPESLYISLALPDTFSLDDLTLLYRGFDRACAHFGCKVRGGDITSTAGPVVINIAITGTSPTGNLRSRAGARPGDMVFLTGPLGTAKADHYRISPDYFTLLPIEKIRTVVTSGKATAMTDISDGLARSLYDIAQRSKVGFVISEENIPLGKNASLDDALNGGEDYQLLFTAAPEGSDLFDEGFYHIGTVVEQSGVMLVRQDGTQTPLTSYGYDHFAEHEDLSG